MDFTLSEEQSLLRDTARAYFAKPAPAKRGTDSRARYWADAAAMGWMAVMVPEETGGIGGSILDGSLLARELGRGNAVLPFTETAILGPAAFRASAEMLGRIVAGDVKLAFALAWDRPPAFTLSGATLSGDRAFLPADPDVEFIVAEAAREDGAPVLAAIPLSHPKVRILRHPSLDGLGALSITVESATLDQRHLLAERNTAPGLIANLRLRECLARAAEITGLMDYLLNLTRDYTLTRQQFGQPIAGFQVIRHRLVEMHAYWQLSESLVFQAADTLVRLGPVREAEQAVRAAFSFAGRQGRRLGKDAVQLHGAIGTMDEYPAGHAFARLVSLSQSCGGTAFQERHYAEAMTALGDTSRQWAL